MSEDRTGDSWRPYLYSGDAPRVESQRARIVELEAERNRLLELVEELSELGCDEDLDLLLPLDQVENRGCGKCLPCRARAALYP